jgi:tetratricopeptide (TPR) repeat protein
MVRVDPSESRAIPAAPNLPAVRSLAFILSAFVILLSASPQEARWVQMSQQVGQLREEERITQAISLAQQTVQVAQTTFGPDDRRVGLSLNVLGLLLSDQDDFADAEASLRRALAILQKASGPQSKDAGAPLLNLAHLYRDHGRWGQAEDAFRDALTIYIQAYGQTDPHVADVLRSGASLMIDEGKLVDAARVLRGAIAIYQNAGPAYRASLAVTLSLAAEDCEWAGDHKTAESLYKQSIDINQKVLSPTDPQLADNLVGLANVYKDEQRYPDAEPLYLHGIAILEHNVGPTDPDYVEAEANLAVFYYAWDRPDQAGPWFDKYIGHRMEQWRANAATMSERDRLGFHATLPGTFPLYFSFATRYHDRDPSLAAKVYDVLLQKRGFVAESAASMRSKIVASGDRDALAMLDKLAADKTQLASLSESSAAAPRPQVSQLTQEVNQLEQQLARRSSALSEANTLAAATWHDVQQALKPGEAAVEIAKFQFHTGRTFVANRIYIALVITPQSKYPNLIVLGDARDLEAAPLTGFRSAVAKTRGVIAEAEPNTPPSAAETANTSAAYDGFWKPLEPAFAGAHRIYIAPDGVLNQLPIGLLADSSGKLVLEKYQLRYLNSTRDLLRPQHPASANSAVLLGDPKFDLAQAGQPTTAAPTFTSLVVTQPSAPTDTLSVTLPVVGTDTLTTGPVNLTVKAGALIAPTITFSVPSHTYGDAPFAVSATSNSTGAITYSMVSGPATISGSTVTLTGAGAVVLKATQAAAGSYLAGTQTATFTVIAPFTITATPPTENVFGGDIAIFLLDIQANNGFNGKVALSCSGGPSGSFCADFPMTVSFFNGTAWALSGIYFPPNTKPGTYTLTFTGVSGTASTTAQANFIVGSQH